MPYGYLSFKMSSRLRDSALPKRELGCLAESPMAKHWFPSSDNTSIYFNMYILKLLHRCRLCWRRVPLLQARLGPVPVWHHLCPCPPAPTCLTSPARSGMLALSEPFPTRCLAFWGDSCYVSRSSAGAAAAGAHCSQPQNRPPCRVSASSQSSTLPSPRLLPEGLAEGKVPRAPGASR